LSRIDTDTEPEPTCMEQVKGDTLLTRNISGS